MGFCGIGNKFQSICRFLKLSLLVFVWLMLLLQAAYARFCGRFEISLN